MKCTTPWLLRVSRELFDDQIEICTGNKSYEAAAFYVENRLPNFEECNNPCTSMEIVSSMKMMKNSSIEDSQARLFFKRTLQVNEETFVKSTLSMIAELGGYLGMTLGISLLDLEYILGSLGLRIKKLIG